VLPRIYATTLRGMNDISMTVAVHIRRELWQKREILYQRKMSSFVL